MGNEIVFAITTLIVFAIDADPVMQVDSFKISSFAACVFQKLLLLMQTSFSTSSYCFCIIVIVVSD